MTAESESHQPETKRRRSKLQQILTSYKTSSDTRRSSSQRLRNRNSFKTKTSDDDEETNEATKSNKESQSANGIMIVRTLEESLLYTDGKGEIDAKHRSKGKMLRRRTDVSLEEVKKDKIIDCDLSYHQMKVSFSNIEIREYPIIPGDNPTVSRGPPLSIDWDYMSQQKIDLEVFERNRVKHRRASSQIKIPDALRNHILVGSGFSLNEIRTASKRANIARRQRLRTIEMLHTSEFQESIEKLRRKLSKPFRRRNLSKNNKNESSQKKDSIRMQTNDPIAISSRNRMYNLSDSARQGNPATLDDSNQTFLVSDCG